MPTHDFTDVGDVLNYEVVQGTIKNVDGATDTCVVTVGGEDLTALLFYHCEHDSVVRSNGAIQGAAGGFTTGDPVCVLKKTNNSVVKVIGHTDGVKRCASSFIEITVAVQKNSDSSWYPIKYVFVWDVKNSTLLYDGVLSTDSAYVAWKATHTTDTDAESTMNPVIPRGNTTSWPPDPGHTDDTIPEESFVKPEDPGPGPDIEQTIFYGSTDYYALDAFTLYLNGFSYYSNLHAYTGYSYFRSNVFASRPTYTVIWRWFGDDWYMITQTGTAIVNHNIYTPLGLIFTYSSSYVWYPPHTIDDAIYIHDHNKLGYVVNKNAGLSCKNFMVNIFTLYGNIFQCKQESSTVIGSTFVHGCQVQIVYDETVEDIRTKSWLDYPINVSLGADIETAIVDCLTGNGLSPSEIGNFTLSVTPQILKNT